MIIEQPYVGVLLHTALRKVCDSPPTSAAWNLFYVIPRPMWNDYVSYIHRNISLLKDDAGDVEITQTVERCSLDFRDDCISVTTPKGESHYFLQCLECIFQTFTADDWKRYASMIVDECRRELKAKAKTG